VRSARSATTGPYCWEASTLINLAELGNKAARRSGSLPEAGSLRHPFIAVSTGGTTGIPKSAVRNQLSYAACALNYLAVGGCTAATPAPGTPTATHSLVERTKNGCPENRNLLRGRRVNIYVNWRSSAAVSTTFAAAVAGGRTEDPLTKPASKRPEGGR
jgi:hypothetical protein